jgi:hypothetical protein
MQTSDSIKEIATALVGFHSQMDKVSKSSTNPYFKSKYADLATILKAIADPLNENGLAIVQFPEGQNELTTRVIHTSGEWMQATYTMPVAKQNDPQALGSAISYQRRYSLMAVLSLTIADEDDDANKASGRTNGQAVSAPNVPTKEEKQMLMNLLSGSTIEPNTDNWMKAFNTISGCNNYKEYEAIQHRLEALQKEPANLSQKDINKKLKPVQS